MTHFVFFNMQTNLFWHCKTGHPIADIFTSQTMDNSKLVILINWTSPFLISGVSGVRFHILFRIEIPLSKQFRP